ncbi:hypothetical protein J3F84DRAFT_357912 [Trichoderma pleuroticola]
MSLAPQLFQLPTHTPFTLHPCKVPSCPSLVAKNPPLGTGAHRPSFPVSQPAGSPGAVCDNEASASFADGWPSPAFRFAGSATCLGLGESESSIAGCLSSRACLFLLPRPP